MISLKRIVRNVLREISYDIIKYPNYSNANFDRMYRDIFKRDSNEIVIFDVGAHRG